MTFLELLGERQDLADPGHLILAQCSKLAGENSTRGVGSPLQPRSVTEACCPDLLQWRAYCL